jgi:hypothetical protein
MLSVKVASHHYCYYHYHHDHRNHHYEQSSSRTVRDEEELQEYPCGLQNICENSKINTSTPKVKVLTLKESIQFTARISYLFSRHPQAISTLQLYGI